MADAAGLPPLEPHPGLWRTFATATVQRPGDYDWATVPAAWLGDLWEELHPVRSAGGRVAQEAIGFPQVRTALQARR